MFEKSKPIPSENDLPEWKRRIIESRNKTAGKRDTTAEEPASDHGSAFGVKLKDPEWMGRLLGNRSSRQEHAHATNFGGTTKVLDEIYVILFLTV
jgi:hypothetical protein